MYSTGFKKTKTKLYHGHVITTNNIEGELDNGVRERLHAVSTRKCEQFPLSILEKQNSKEKNITKSKGNMSIHLRVALSKSQGLKGLQKTEQATSTIRH